MFFFKKSQKGDKPANEAANEKNCYEGELVDGVRNGMGTMRFANGNTYTGQWKNGVMHGLGEFHFASSKDYYIGKFINGNFGGLGRFHYSNGDVYEGHFLNGKRDGSGTLIKANGNRLEGNFINGKVEGYVKYFYADGKIYHGMFSDEKLTDGFLITKNKAGQWVEIRFGSLVNEPEKPALYLVSYPEQNKLRVIKEIREVTGYGLAMAKDIAENVPQLIKTNVSQQDIDDITRRFTPLNAVIKLEE